MSRRHRSKSFNNPNVGELVIPEKIAQFILASIDSVAELEALLILKRSAPQKWNGYTLAKRLYINESQTEKLLRGLCEKHLAASDAADPGNYSYAPRTRKLDGTSSVNF